MNPVNWFEIPVSDMARARRFYERVLGLQMQDMSMPGYEMTAFPMERDAPNAAGALVKGENTRPSEGGTIVYFACDDVADNLGRVAGAGGQVLSDKQSIGEYGFIGIVRDTEGNTIGLHSRK